MCIAVYIVPQGVDRETDTSAAATDVTDLDAEVPPSSSEQDSQTPSLSHDRRQ